MQWWENFQQLEYSNELLVGLGLLLLIVGVMKILRSGLRMLLWIVLCSVGMGAIAHGISGKKIKLPFNSSNEISEYVANGEELSSEALQLLCSKLDEN